MLTLKLTLCTLFVSVCVCDKSYVLPPRLASNQYGLVVDNATGHPNADLNTTRSNLTLARKLRQSGQSDAFFGGDSDFPIYSGDNSFISNTDFERNWDSLKTRIAPKDEDLQGGGYVISEQRLKELRREFMYWYFDQGGNDGNGDYQFNIQSSTKVLHKNFNYQFPFFGFRFNYTRVSLDGYLEFSDPPPTYHYPLVFPNKDWPKQNDPAFIGIFFSKCRVGELKPNDVDRRKPGVYFRLERNLEDRHDKFGVEVRERLMWDIREGVVGAETFVPKHVAIVTWKNVSFNGGNEYANTKTNTFQAILATDEVFSYVIFNYLTMVWTTHTEAGGDPTSGEGGTPAYIGFNAGNGTQSYEYYPYSQRSTVRDLTGRGWANGFPGRHIFRVDEKILLGNCNKDVSGTNLPLVFAPESGNMLGGTVVNITGPCFERTDKITCRFDQEETIGTYQDRNRVICIQPRMFVEGYVPFEIAIGSDKFNWVGKYFVETPATAAEKIFFDKHIHEKSPRSVRITWNKYNLTTNENARVTISLWGYREVSIRPELHYIDVIQEGYTNVGYYTINPNDYKNLFNEYENDMEFGFLQINLTKPEDYSGLAITPVIWSRPIPLSWYFAPQWERQYGYKWPEALCNKWLMNDRYLKNFAHEINQCPCTLEQALNDKGRFLPDPNCDIDLYPRCIYNRGAVHCVRSGAPSLEGAEQQCCYDKNHFLMLSYDQQWGSRPFRSHNLGYIPWNEANKVPTLSQWYHDFRPIYSCCLWQEEQSVGCETLRFERRPSQDCIGYQAPGIATVFGDPHVVTFDNLPYTFNGKGEFVLTRVNTPRLKLDVQGRFEQLPPNYFNETRATQLTAVAAQGNNSAIIEVRVRPRDAQWRYRLDVLANGAKVYFDRPSLKVQHFPGVLVYTPTYILNQSEVVIMFESGAGVEVVENQGFMSARVYLPWSFINTTVGLFGNWSFDPTDDFVNPDGIKVAVPLNVTNLRSFERVHKDFAMNWILEDKADSNKGRALFTRENGKTATTYTNKTFEPIFLINPEDILPKDSRSDEINQAYEFCGEIYQCRYDYAVSLNRDLAHFTKNYYNTYTKIRDLNRQRVISCGVLETPRFGRKSNFYFIPGTKVTFECNENFVLVGDQRRTCLPNGKWNVPEYGYTECLRYVEYDSQQLLKTGAFIALFIVPLFIALCLAGRYAVRKARKEQSWEFTTPRSRSASRMRLNEVDSGTSSPLKPDLDSASSNKSTLKRPRSYDAVYYTGEPIPGKPNAVQGTGDRWDDDLSPTSPRSTISGGFTNVAKSVPNLNAYKLERNRDSFEPMEMAAVAHDSDSDYATLDEPFGSGAGEPYRRRGSFSTMESPRSEVANRSGSQEILDGAKGLEKRRVFEPQISQTSNRVTAV